MDVSVVVSTFQRADFLPGLVAALEAQTLSTGRFEVVIVDDASADDTPAVLERLQSTSTVAIRVLRAEENGGPAHGRNLGWRAATAPVVAFTDDDCLPTPGWLEAGLAAMADGHRVCCGATNPTAEAWRARGPFSVSLWVSRLGQFETCNIFYRRVDLEAAGGFDESFRTGEDTDLGLRVIAGGAEAVFVEDALVHHAVHRSSFRSALRRALRWTDLPLLVKLHPEARQRYHHRIFWRASHPRVVLLALGALLALRWRAALLLALPWLSFRVREQPVLPGRKLNVLLLPAVLVLDGAEVAALARGSVRHRTLFL